MKAHYSKVQTRGHLLFDMHINTFRLALSKLPRPLPTAASENCVNHSTRTRGHPRAKELSGPGLGLDCHNNCATQRLTTTLLQQRMLRPPLIYSGGVFQANLNLERHLRP